MSALTVRQMHPHIVVHVHSYTVEPAASPIKAFLCRPHGGYDYVQSPLQISLKQHVPANFVQVLYFNVVNILKVVHSGILEQSRFWQRSAVEPRQGPRQPQLSLLKGPQRPKAEVKSLRIYSH